MDFHNKVVIKGEPSVEKHLQDARVLADWAQRLPSSTENLHPEPGRPGQKQATAQEARVPVCPLPAGQTSTIGAGLLPGSVARMLGKEC